MIEALILLKKLDPKRREKLVKEYQTVSKVIESANVEEILGAVEIREPDIQVTLDGEAPSEWLKLDCESLGDDPKERATVSLLVIKDSEATSNKFALSDVARKFAMISKKPSEEKNDETLMVGLLAGKAQNIKLPKGTYYLKYPVEQTYMARLVFKTKQGDTVSDLSEFQKILDPKDDLRPEVFHDFSMIKFDGIEPLGDNEYYEEEELKLAFSALADNGTNFYSEGKRVEVASKATNDYVIDYHTLTKEDADEFSMSLPAKVKTVKIPLSEKPKFSYLFLTVQGMLALWHKGEMTLLRNLHSKLTGHNIIKSMKVFA